MERRPRARYPATTYPTRDVEPTRRSVLAGLGTAVGAVALSAVLQGCPPPNDDDDTASGAFDCRLPPTDSRTVYIDWGNIDYHVQIGEDDSDLHDFIDQETGPLTDAVDGLLASHEIYAFAPGEDLTAIETAIAQFVADTYTGNEASPLDAFAYVMLSIDHYDEGEEIAGMEG